jgi:hypothetical protein
MYLHHSRQVGDITVLKDVVPSLTYLEDTALDLPSYSTSLHGYLKQNLEKQYPGVTLGNIKRTTLYPETFGRAFFYDIDLAQRLLGFNSKWTGPREGTGFAAEVEKANYNLGLVESAGSGVEPSRSQGRAYSQGTRWRHPQVHGRQRTIESPGSIVWPAHGSASRSGLCTVEEAG